MTDQPPAQGVQLDNPGPMLDALQALGCPTVITTEDVLSISAAAQIAGSLHAVTELGALMAVDDGHAPSVHTGYMSVLIQSTGGDPEQRNVAPVTTAYWLTAVSQRLDFMRVTIENSVHDDSAAVAVLLDALRIAGTMSAFIAGVLTADVDRETRDKLTRETCDKLTTLVLEIIDACFKNVVALREELGLEGSDAH
jgi:hypothetical protein